MIRVKDPSEDTLVFNENHKIVITEGLYLLTEQCDSDDGSDDVNSAGYISSSWSRIRRQVLDLSIFVDVPLDVCAERVISRHVRSGISADRHSAQVRWESNDYLNAITVYKAQSRADMQIPNIELN